MALGALTGFPQSAAWHLEKGFTLCGVFLAFDNERFLAHSPQ